MMPSDIRLRMMVKRQLLVQPVYVVVPIMTFSATKIEMNLSLGTV